jgi:hypothetical protein
MLGNSDSYPRYAAIAISSQVKKGNEGAIVEKARPAKEKWVWEFLKTSATF